MTTERTPDRTRLVAAGALLTEAAALLADPRPPVDLELHPELPADFGPLRPLAAALAEHEPEILAILGTEPLTAPAAPLEACPPAAREALDALAGFLVAVTSGPAAARDRAWRVVAEALALAAASGRTFSEVWSWPTPAPPPPRRSAPLPRRADDPDGWDAAMAALRICFAGDLDEEQARTATPAPPLWPEDLEVDGEQKADLDRDQVDGEQLADGAPLALAGERPEVTR